MKTVFYGIICGIILIAGMQGVYYYAAHPAMFTTFEVGDIWCDEIEEEDANPYIEEIAECGKIISIKEDWIEWVRIKDSKFYGPYYFGADHFMYRFGTKQTDDK